VSEVTIARVFQLVAALRQIALNSGDPQAASVAEYAIVNVFGSDEAQHILGSPNPNNVPSILTLFQQLTDKVTQMAGELEALKTEVSAFKGVVDDAVAFIHALPAGGAGGTTGVDPAEIGPLTDQLAQSRQALTAALSAAQSAGSGVATSPTPAPGGGVSPVDPSPVPVV
jgi:hypothetical protein